MSLKEISLWIYYYLMPSGWKGAPSCVHQVLYIVIIDPHSAHLTSLCNILGCSSRSSCADLTRAFISTVVMLAFLTAAATVIGIAEAFVIIGQKQAQMRETWQTVLNIRKLISKSGSKNIVTNIIISFEIRS
jgi:hypothetical protein